MHKIAQQTSDFRHNSEPFRHNLDRFSAQFASFRDHRRPAPGQGICRFGTWFRRTGDGCTVRGANERLLLGLLMDWSGLGQPGAKNRLKTILDAAASRPHVGADALFE